MPKEKEPIRLWPASPAEQIAREELIGPYHPHLAEARILYLFTNQERKSKGKVVVAFTSKLSGAAKYLSSGDTEDIDEGYDFLILISAEVWEQFTESQRRAMVDHELSHCVGEETDDGFKWTITAHDVEEFSAVIERHGLWNREVRHFADQLAEQLKLV